VLILCFDIISSDSEPGQLSPHTDGPGARRPRDWDSIPGRGRDFSSLHNVQTGCGAHPVSHPVDVGALFPGVKQPGREADHSHLCSVETKYMRDFILSTDSLKVCSNG
jgi:hypothetical protein